MSQTVHYFPLEHLENRYTGFLDRLIVAELKRQPRVFIRYYPEATVESRAPAGNFYGTAQGLAFRSLQIAAFARNVAEGTVKRGDLLFFSDLLLPGLEVVGYLQHFHDLNLDIRGIVHAGSFSDADLTRGFERWYSRYEEIALELASQVFLGSRFIHDDLLAKRLVGDHKLVITGFELDPALADVRPQPNENRELTVLFTGRLSPDKQPWLFDKLARRFHKGPGQPVFVKTVERNLRKAEYYNLLSRAKVVVSFALQETFGTGIREAVKLGCVPVVPDAQCYPEDFPADYRYTTFDEAENLVRKALTGQLPVPEIREYPASTERWFW